MPSRMEINPSQHYTDMDPEIRSQFKKKGWHADLRLSKAKGLYVADDFFHVAPEETIRHKEIFKDKRQKMIAAGREVEERLKAAINREFPQFSPGQQSLGDYALAGSQARKIDSWAYNERVRIEELSEDSHYESKDIDFPYQLNVIQKKALLGEKLTAIEKEQLLESALTIEQKAALTSQMNNGDMEIVVPDSWASRERERIEQQLYDPNTNVEDIEFLNQLDGVQRKLLLDEKLTAAEKEHLLKSTLTDEQRATLVSEVNGFDMQSINNRVLEGLSMSARFAADADTRGMARDHLSILKARDFYPDDPIATARHARRHRIVEQNRLLRNAIANDLRHHPHFGRNADAAAAAERIVSNLQGSSEVLSPLNRWKAVELLKSLGCECAEVTGLADTFKVEEALRGTIPFARDLNASIERSASGPEFQAERDNLKFAVQHNTFILKNVADLVGDARLHDPGARARASRRLIDSAVLLADLCSQPLFKNAAMGSPAQRLSEKLAEQARIANELAQALKNPSICGDLPSLKKVALPASHSSVDPALASSPKRREANRLLKEAIVADLRSDANFQGDAADTAANIVSQLQSARSILTPNNIVTVQELLGSLGFPNTHVGRLNGYVDLEQKLSTAIPQLRELNKSAVAAMKSMGGNPVNRLWYYSPYKENIARESDQLLNEADRLLKSGRFDDNVARQRLYDSLRDNLWKSGRLLSLMQKDMQGKAPQQGFLDACEALEAQMAAVCDLAQALCPFRQDDVVSRSVERFYPRSLQNSARLQNTDSAILNERVETPNVLFRSDSQRWRAHEMLTEPLRVYNSLLDRISAAFQSFKNSHGTLQFDNFRALVANALRLNDHLTSIFSSVNKLRNTGKNGRYDDETPVLQDQRECLQALQAGALRALGAPRPLDEVFRPKMPTLEEDNDAAEFDWNDLPTITSVAVGRVDENRVASVENPLLIDLDDAAEPVNEIDFTLTNDVVLEDDNASYIDNIDDILKEQAHRAKKESLRQARRRQNARMKFEPKIQTISEDVEVRDELLDVDVKLELGSASDDVTTNGVPDELETSSDGRGDASDRVATAMREEPLESSDHDR